MVSVPFGSFHANKTVTCSDYEGSTACQWECEKVPGRASGGGSQDHSILVLITSLTCACLVHLWKCRCRTRTKPPPRGRQVHSVLMGTLEVQDPNTGLFVEPSCYLLLLCLLSRFLLFLPMTPQLTNTRSKRCASPGTSLVGGSQGATRVLARV